MDPVREWWQDTMPIIKALLVAGLLAIDVQGTDEVPVSEVAAHIKDTTDQARCWLAGHPCPDESIGMALGELVGRYAVIAERYEGQLLAGMSPVVLRAGAAEIGLELAQCVNDLQKRIEDL